MQADEGSAEGEKVGVGILSIDFPTLQDWDGFKESEPEKNHPGCPVGFPLNQPQEG